MEDIKFLQEKNQELILLPEKRDWGSSVDVKSKVKKLQNTFGKKRNLISKQMKKVVDKNGSVVEEPNAIMKSNAVTLSPGM